jgi:hypothetical protein
MDTGTPSNVDKRESVREVVPNQVPVYAVSFLSHNPRKSRKENQKSDPLETRLEFRWIFSEAATVTKSTTVL